MARAGDGLGRDGAPRRKRRPAGAGGNRGRRPHLLGEARVPPLRHRLPGTGAATVLVQQPPGNVPGLQRSRRPVGSGRGPGRAGPRPRHQRRRGGALGPVPRPGRLGGLDRSRGGEAVCRGPEPALGASRGGEAAGDPVRLRRPAVPGALAALPQRGTVGGRDAPTHPPDARDELGAGAALVFPFRFEPPLPRLRRDTAAPGGALGADRRAEPRRVVADVHRRRALVHEGAVARRRARGDRRGVAEGDRGAAPVPRRCGARLPVARPVGAEPLRRRVAAHPARQPDRVRVDRRRLYPR